LGQSADLTTVRTHDAVDDVIQGYTANSLSYANGRSAAFDPRAVNMLRSIDPGNLEEDAHRTDFGVSRDLASTGLSPLEIGRVGRELLVGSSFASGAAGQIVCIDRLYRMT
jgi:hypothetical protein